MKPIVTLTLNPALDVTTATRELAPVRKLRCTPPRFDPGGGGINVARVIHRLGGRAIALYAAGGATGQMLAGLLDAEGIDHRLILVKAATRQNFMVHEQATQNRFRFVMPGAALEEAEWQRCLERLDELAAEADYVVVSGSMPAGVPEDFLAQAARRIRRRGARFVVDSSGPALEAALAEGVDLIKPNEDEICALAGRPLNWPQDQQAFAAELVARGASNIVVVSHGADGALAVAADSCTLVDAADVEVVSAVGAGDSYVAGLVLGLARGQPLPDAARLGAAAAGATLLTPGTELGRRDDAERLFDSIAARPCPQ